jgi:hypothetical protein
VVTLWCHHYISWNTSANSQAVALLWGETMKILSRLRELLHSLRLGTWGQILMGELIAVAKPATDLRR